MLTKIQIKYPSIRNQVWDQVNNQVYWLVGDQAKEYTKNAY